MKQDKAFVAASGLTLLYEPAEPSTAIVDIVFVAGLGGHPVKTWQHSSKVETPRTPKSPGRKGSLREILRKNSLKKCTSDPELKASGDEGTLIHPRQRNVLRKKSDLSYTRSETVLTLNNREDVRPPRRHRSTSRLKIEIRDNITQPKPEVEIYWPLDFLPISVPNTRIFTWGCQTLATNSKLLPAQQNVFSHADELLHDLATHRDGTRSSGRAIVFVAHSLGGVVVKEVLRRSDMMSEPSMKDIVQSTLSVIFIGCPHRDNQHGKLGDAVASMASAMLGLASADEVLQDLSGAKSPTLELGRQSFVRIWNNYNIRVRTYQEEQPTQSTLRDTKPEHELRREASSFGDPRERAEVIDAHHLDMCKFRSVHESAYRSLSFTIIRFVGDEFNRLRDLDQKERACLQAVLSSPTFPRDTQHSDSYPGTCLWLYDLPEFRSWHHRVEGAKSKMLWIKGRPGSGKSILLRSLLARVEQQWGPIGGTFIWSVAQGETLDDIFFPGSHRRKHGTSPAGVYRNLIAQLFKQDPRLRKAIASVRNRATRLPLDDLSIVQFFIDDYIDQRIETPVKRTFIFVDAADDCGVAYLTDLACYLAQLAMNSDYSICLASASHPDVTVDNAIEIITHQRNLDDILRFVSLNLVAEWEDRNRTVVRIGAKAGGCFLWAEIVVQVLNSAIEEGASQELIDTAIMDMPEDVDGLYEWLFSAMSSEEKAETLTLFRWALLSSESPRLNDLRIAMRLTKSWNYGEIQPHRALDIGPAMSIRDLRRPASEAGAFDTPYQFHRWIRSRSIGLLELQPAARDGVTSEPLGLQRVQVIHESVRTFFLSGRGLACLSCNTSPTHNPSRAVDMTDKAHYSILHACLTYLNMADFEPLGSGKLAPAPMSVEESKYWRSNARDQRRLVMSSYPFLQYAVDNLLFHLLSPRAFRYYLPQMQIFRLFSANRCRLWRRWTALLGCSSAEPEAMLAICADGTARDLLSPVFGTQTRIERVFRKLSRVAPAGSPNTIPRSPPVVQEGRHLRHALSERWLDRPSPQSSTFRSPTAPTIFSPISISVESPISPMSIRSEPAAFSPYLGS